MPTEAERIHQAIMNLPHNRANKVALCDYVYGHRDARHAAAELAQESVAKLEARNAKLREACEDAWAWLHSWNTRLACNSGTERELVEKLRAAIAGEGERE